MDAFDNDELYQIRSSFYQGNFQNVVNEPIDSLTRSDEARLYQYRSRIELSQSAAVAVEMAKAGTDGAGFQAVKAFAEYRSGNNAKAVEDINKLIQTEPDDKTVQVIGATILYSEGQTDEALELLSKHESNLEAVALIIQIRLAQHNIEAAEKELAAAKRWAQDSLLAQLAEAWVILAKGGDNAQGAYYIYEELAQSASSTAKSLLGQAVAEIQLGRLPEAESTLKQALEKDPQNPDILANAVVCATLSGKDPTSYFDTLKKKEHPLLRDMAEKSAMFDSASANYGLVAA